MGSKQQNTFLNNVDTEVVTDLLNQTEDNSKYFVDITNKVVYSYTNDLDMLIQSIKMTNDSDLEIDITTLDRYILSLSNLLYFVGNKLELVGVRADVAKAARQEVYNRAYLSNQLKDEDKKNKTTIAENIAVAEEESKYQGVIQNIYERVYKVIKFKVDAGYELLSSLKKILSRRMQEVDIDRFQPKA